MARKTWVIFWCKHLIASGELPQESKGVATQRQTEARLRSYMYRRDGLRSVILGACSKRNSMMLGYLTVSN